MTMMRNPACEGFASSISIDLPRRSRDLLPDRGWLVVLLGSRYQVSGIWRALSAPRPRLAGLGWPGPLGEGLVNTEHPWERLSRWTLPSTAKVLGC